MAGIGIILVGLTPVLGLSWASVISGIGPRPTCLLALGLGFYRVRFWKTHFISQVNLGLFHFRNLF